MRGNGYALYRSNLLLNLESTTPVDLPGWEVCFTRPEGSYMDLHDLKEELRREKEKTDQLENVLIEVLDYLYQKEVDSISNGDFHIRASSQGEEFTLHQLLDRLRTSRSIREYS